MPIKAERSITVVCEPTRVALGQRAGAHAALVLQDALRGCGRARVMLAAAPSQSATLAALAASDGIDWARVDLFHMDEYVGLASNAPQGFATWLAANFVVHLPDATFHRIDPGDDPA